MGFLIDQPDEIVELISAYLCNKDKLSLALTNTQFTKCALSTLDPTEDWMKNFTFVTARGDNALLKRWVDRIDDEHQYVLVGVWTIASIHRNFEAIQIIVPKLTSEYYNKMLTFHSIGTCVDLKLFDAYMLSVYATEKDYNTILRVICFKADERSSETLYEIIEIFIIPGMKAKGYVVYAPTLALFLSREYLREFELLRVSLPSDIGMCCVRHAAKCNWKVLQKDFSGNDDINISCVRHGAEILVK